MIGEGTSAMRREVGSRDQLVRLAEEAGGFGFGLRAKSVRASRRMGSRQYVRG